MHLHKLRSKLLLSAVTASVITPVSTAAFAQGADIPVLETVTVTAEHRSEDLQKTALSITALAGSDLVKQGKNDINDILRSVPSVQIQGGPFAGTVYIRGIGPTLTTDPSVAISVDGIYQTDGFINATYDVARVEVLKGPQGLLYGRNATGGAVNLITNDPVLGEYHAGASLQFGNYAAFRTEDYVNLPLGDDLAARAAFMVNRHNGYMDNGTNDDRSVAGRLKVLYKPTETVSLLVGGDMTHTGGHGNGQYVLEGGPSNPQIAYWAASGYSANMPNPPDPTYHAIAPAGRVDSQKYGMFAKLDWNTDVGVVTYIPSWYTYFQHFDTPGPIPPGGFYYVSPTIHGPGGFTATDNHISQMTQELRIASHDEAPWKWLLGFYYLNYKQRTTGDFATPLAPDQYGTGTFATMQFYHAAPACDLGEEVPGSQPGCIENPINETKSWAIFGQTTYPITDEFRVTAGLRYTHDTKHTEYYRADDTAGAFSASDVRGSVNKEATAITWKGGVEYDLTPDSMLYASISRGYKAGGFRTLSANYTGAVPSGIITSWTPDYYKPEYVIAYEIGSKNRFLDNTLQLNADAFYYDYKDQQQFILGAPLSLGQPPQPQAINVPKSKSYGVELEGQWAVTQNDLFTASVVYNHTEFGTFIYGPTAATDSGGAYLIVNKTGTPWVLAPEWQENIGYQHTFDMSDGSTVTLSGDMRFSSSYVTTIELHPDVIQPAFHRSDARLTYESPSKKWSASIFVDNIEDIAIRQFVFGFQGPPGGPPPFTSTYADYGYYQTQLAPPRTYGVTFDYKM